MKHKDNTSKFEHIHDTGEAEISNIRRESHKDIEKKIQKNNCINKGKTISSSSSHIDDLVFDSSRIQEGKNTQ